MEKSSFWKITVGLKHEVKYQPHITLLKKNETVCNQRVIIKLIIWPSRSTENYLNWIPYQIFFLNRIQSKAFCVRNLNFREFFPPQSILDTKTHISLMRHHFLKESL